MNASTISNGLAAIVAAIPNTHFMRATDQDANTDIDQVDITGKILVIYNNLPTVEHAPNVGGSVFRTWPVEIRVLKLADYDDNTVQGDTLRDDCMAVADNIYDKLTSQFNDYPEAEEYALALLGEVKVYSKTLTGVRLTFALNVRRSVYYC